MARLSKKAVRESIEHYSGNISAVARSFDVSRRTVYDYVKKRYPELWETVIEERERWKDDAESELMRQAVEKGNVTALIFFLKTQAKERGYVERWEHEHTGKDKGPIEVTMVEVVKDYGDGDGDSGTAAE